LEAVSLLSQGLDATPLRFFPLEMTREGYIFGGMQSPSSFLHFESSAVSSRDQSRVLVSEVPYGKLNSVRWILATIQKDKGR
jgi:hypothetical protein